MGDLEDTCGRDIVETRGSDQENTCGRDLVETLVCYAMDTS